MNKLTFNTLFIASLLFFFSLSAGSIYAQTSQLNNSTDNHTAREEQEGKQIWEKLQAKQVECKTLTDDNYASLGEYFMGQMTGNSHEAMNNMMIQMMGEQGEEQMHIVMGKRLSGCDANAEIPQSGIGFMPMMWMMRGGQQFPFNQTGNSITSNWWGGFGWWFFQLIAVVWLIVGVLAAAWLFKQISKK
ncbi:MAG: hypothetical protein UT54_C0061G0005 [Candidatus Daviesbacteria bacterium GW2011_GWB1_39_5]|uniref:Uncharacterized protein n=1 Tax=Candidatus Daviesbacteria bacterium GW2011_GWC2_40_12 TaxID=1618431 RepID=A0A0G0TWK6_9BACT|nr:MAG: hypothetical protein UT04_C0001G0032 [Candidatus Daviesbacteria bacterium GW2011_GWF2_38_7]KKR16867.1 MAG: hypothetical protein UT45_C0004G0198 [Candidatus Daviesbacteria bacterium GW2011_GWA2_39_33]KKR22829.1 MAG: hypothetical protein UT54_C0061G0005 [Candidatus Daviesbacteria bacterium GW2011_GWB1_39_5]KKR42352.1 MAG: hypothetical protein UT77_C0002G0005 [Candidatus Daviesbacteria bacterium GW2011_GWC2_40_12]OGE42224.1 MAG: hypothetical protein A3A53_00025 [Candidatus Daviesbacteria b